MDKETLSNYGWIVICVLVLSVMIALATPFGSYVADGFKAAYNGFGDTNTEATDMMYSAVGVKVPASCGIEGHYKGDNRGTHGIPATNCPKGHKYTCECVSWVVPEGGTYTMKRAVNGKSVYNAGEALPNHYVVNYLDKYEDTDYTYTIDFRNSSDASTFSWAVKVKDRTKTEYGEIRSDVANILVKNLSGTFYNCTSLTTAPVIPYCVTNMRATFTFCKSLKTYVGSTDADGDFSNYVIPNGVTTLSETFRNCSLLTKAPVIPSSVTNMFYAFLQCNNLTTAPIIPNGVTDMNSTFEGCSKLKTYAGSTDADGDFSNYIIPNGVTNMSFAFHSCRLTTAPVIPSSVTNMQCTFSDTKLTTAPAIPNSVTNMLGTFSYCYSLKGQTITIPASVTDPSETSGTWTNGPSWVKK